MGVSYFQKIVGLRGLKGDIVEKKKDVMQRDAHTDIGM